MNDLISRKAILKHIEEIRQKVQMMDDTHRASIIMNGMYLCEKAVKNQPSAQPEIIRCKDCKYAKWDDKRGDYICNGRAVWENHYCGYAKRKGEEHD